MAAASKQICWTPAERDGFVTAALSSTDKRGHSGPYWFNVLPKISSACADHEDERRTKVTRALMKAIMTRPEYRVIALKIFDILLYKIASHPLTRRMYQRDIIVTLKGGTAYTYVVSAKWAETFPFSDLDIVIAINPYLPRDLFNRTREVLNTLVLQTISQYKRMLDHMLFLNKPIEEQILDETIIANFKEDLMAAFASLEDERGGSYISPVATPEVRNAVSKHSVMLRDSLAQEDRVVRIEVPHFEQCERIPLRKSPVMCSHNSSIRFNRTPNAAKETIGHFDLYRVRINCMYKRNDAQSSDDDAADASSTSSRGRDYDTIAADFIDISMLAQDDAELWSFWDHGQVTSVYDRFVGMWITIPDLPTMLDDLYKMLHVYECPESKRSTRELKFKVLKDVYHLKN
jgi:hypothetical protein